MRAQIEGPYGRLVNVNLDMEKVRLLREKDTEIRGLQQQMQQLEVRMCNVWRVLAGIIQLVDLIYQCYQVQQCVLHVRLC